MGENINENWFDKISRWIRLFFKFIWNLPGIVFYTLFKSVGIIIRLLLIFLIISLFLIFIGYMFDIEWLKNL